MKQARIAAQRILAAADYPGEILTGVPVVELKGTAEAVVLGHRGVIAYEPQQLQIASSLGPVVIQGAELRIRRMNRERIVLLGKIRRVELPES
ncbi:MAG: hypothetical protein IKQ04_03610 [Oscillospiraceae bacterium]|nr:hypothetical protein [Oscillospiraceae bacterium]